MKIATEYCIKCSNEDANKAYSKVYDGFTATSAKEAHRKGFVEGYNYLADRVAELEEEFNRKMNPESAKELTIEQISDLLGYEIKIVKKG